MRLSRMEREEAGHLRAWLSAEAENIAVQDALERQSRKSGMLLALGALTGLTALLLAARTVLWTEAQLLSIACTVVAASAACLLAHLHRSSLSEMRRLEIELVRFDALRLACEAAFAADDGPLIREAVETLGRPETNGAGLRKRKRTPRSEKNKRSAPSRPVAKILQISDFR
jgi:hypothetical protein